VLDAAEALWFDEIRERTLVERRVIAARMAQAEEFDLDLLPDVDKAAEAFAEWMSSDVGSPEDLTPEDVRRRAIGLERKR
jgi:hypothetical protein